MDRAPKTVPPRWWNAAVPLVALLATAWTVFLPFQLDDYVLIPGSELALASRPAGGDAYLFRPVVWGLWQLLLQVGGGEARAPLFHAVMVVFHALAAWLLFRLLRGFLGASPAAGLGAMAFAVAPGGLQAVSWISAGGDQLALTGVLLAALSLRRARRGSSLPWGVAAALALACACGAKESALALLPALAVVWLVPADRGTSPPEPLRRATLKVASLLALAVVVLLASRAFYLGTWKPAYAVELSLSWDRLRLVPDLLLQLLVPWNRAEVFADLAPLSARGLAPLLAEETPAALGFVGALFLALPCVLGCLVAPRRAGLPFLVALLVLAGALLPPLLIFGGDGTNVVSRALYPATAVLAAAVAVAVRPLAREGPRQEATPGLLWLLLPFLLLWGDLHLHVARTEMRAASRVRERLASLEELAAGLPAKALLVAVDPECGMGGIPLLCGSVVPATQPPFRATRLPLLWSARADEAARHPELRTQAGPLQILQVSGERFVPVGPPLPPLPAEPPRLEADPEEKGTWRFSPPVQARAVAGLRLRARPQGSAAAQVVWLLEGGPPRAAALGTLALPGGGERILPAPEDLEWLSAPALRGCRIEGATLEGEPEVLASLPRIEVLEPAAGTRLPVGALPQVVFRPEQPASRYRLVFDFALGTGVRARMVYSVLPERLEALPGGRLSFTPAPDDSVEWPDEAQGVTWHTLPEHFERGRARSGKARLAVDLRVEGLGPGAVLPEALSPWRTFSVVAAPRP